MSLQSAQASGSERSLSAARENYNLYEKRAETTATPFLYTVFGTIRSGNYEADLDAYTALSLAVFVACVLLLGRWLSLGATASFAAVALLGLGLFAMWQELWVRNVNLVQLGMLTAAVALRRMRRARTGSLLAGVVLGLGVMLKPNLAPAAGILALSLLGRRRLAELAWLAGGGAAGAGAAFAWSSIYFRGASVWVAWSDMMFRWLPTAYRTWSHNYAPSAAFNRWFGWDLSFWPLVVTGGAAALAVLLAPRGSPAAGPAGRRAAFEQDLLALGIGVAVSLLGPSLAWPHYYVLLIPLCLYALRPAGAGRAWPAWRPAWTHVVGAAALIGMLNWGRVLRPPLSWAVATVGHMGAAALLYALAMWGYVRAGRGAPSPAAEAGP